MTLIVFEVHDGVTVFKTAKMRYIYAVPVPDRPTRRVTFDIRDYSWFVTLPRTKTRPPRIADETHAQVLRDAIEAGHLDVHRCDNCQKVHLDFQIEKDIKRLHERVDPGGEMPSGECPECGALCYPVEAPPAPSVPLERRTD
jgi:hypothetical protein